MRGPGIEMEENNMNCPSQLPLNPALPYLHFTYMTIGIYDINGGTVRGPGIEMEENNMNWGVRSGATASGANDDLA